MNPMTDLNDIIADFQEVHDRMERLEMLFELVEHLDPLPREDWSDSTRVRGCQSEAHVEVTFGSKGAHLRGGGDAMIVQGLIALTAIAIEGRSPEQVRTMSPEFASEMGILHSLTPSRSNGFRTMFDMVKRTAEEALA